MLNAVLDAWGKIPSGVLEGNMVEFGSFSECFNIKRDGELYKSKYCLPQILFKLDGVMGELSKISEARSYQSVMNNIYFSHNFESDDNNKDVDDYNNAGNSTRR